MSTKTRSSESDSYANKQGKENLILGVSCHKKVKESSTTKSTSLQVNGNGNLVGLSAVIGG